MMKILITNDDGIASPLLKVLAEVAVKYGETVCFAPCEEQSGKSQAITVYKKTEWSEAEDIVPNVKTYVVKGTPTDCVAVARRIFDYDLVLAGINRGYNLGRDVYYSGTVGAATEGALDGKYGIAMSVARKGNVNIKEAAEEVLDFVFKENLLDLNPLWNINIPQDVTGMKYTVTGEEGIRSYNMKQGMNPLSAIFDLQAVKEGYVSITPLKLNRTDTELWDRLNKNGR